MPTQRYVVEQDESGQEPFQDPFDATGAEFAPPVDQFAGAESESDPFEDETAEPDDPIDTEFDQALEFARAGRSPMVATTGVELTGASALISDLAEDAEPDMEVDKMHLEGLLDGIQAAVQASQAAFVQQQQQQQAQALQGLTQQDPFATVDQGQPSPLGPGQGGDQQQPPSGDLLGALG